MVQTGITDAWHPNITSEFMADIVNTVQAVNGHLSLEPVSGKAFGNYTYDVSGYIIAFIIGTEWDPNLVVATNAANPNTPGENGNFFFTS